MTNKLRVCVIGGGIFGLTAAIYLSKFSSEIKIFDKNQTILNGATRFNHNRHHFGYHYPRSIDTAVQCINARKDFDKFYRNSIDYSFKNFYAIKNKGAFCNKKKITVGETNKLECATIAISSSESDKLEKKKLKIKDIEKIGSIAYKIALVAKGKIDATLSFTRKSDWDIAAASLILEEAGGKISLINGDEISYNTKDLKIPSLISANKIIHKKFCDIIHN